MLFLAGTALLWWNEGRAVKTEKMLDEAGSKYVEMENPNKKDASLEGELICGTAMATTEDSLTDDQFGIGAKAIALSRTVEYYQWVEHAQEESKDKLGGKEEITTTYIGDLVMERLKKMDDVAYVRYASVHRQFKDINSLFEEVSKLLKEGND